MRLKQSALRGLLAALVLLVVPAPALAGRVLLLDQSARHERAVNDPAVPATLLGDTAGLHVVLELRRGSGDAVAAAARERGVVVQTLRRYFGGRPTADGLVLGYGGLPLGAVAAAAAVLRDVLLELPAR